MIKCTNNKFKYQDLKQHLLNQIRSGTVSNGQKIESEPVLSRTFGLSRNTVRQAISELESEGVLYRLQGKGTFVRNTVPVKSRKIALLIYDTAYTAHPVTGTLIQGIDEVLSSQGYVLDILAGKRGFHEENLAHLGTQYAGFLIGAYQLNEMTLSELDRMQTPFLFVKNYRPDRLDLSMRIDFEKAGYLVAEHLIQCGRHNLGLVYSGDSIAISCEFRKGVVNAALEYGVRFRASHCMTAEFSDSAILEDIAQRLSKDPERPDGIICFSDEQAIALMSALMRCGVTIPEEIAVTGCNNSALASLVSPSLTSVSIPIAELGRRSAAMLLSMIGGAPCEPICLEPALILRKSSGAEPDSNQTTGQSARDVLPGRLSSE